MSCEQCGQGIRGMYIGFEFSASELEGIAAHVKRETRPLVRTSAFFSGEQVCWALLLREHLPQQGVVRYMTDGQALFRLGAYVPVRVRSCDSSLVEYVSPSHFAGRIITFSDRPGRIDRF